MRWSETTSFADPCRGALEIWVWLGMGVVFVAAGGCATTGPGVGSGVPFDERAERLPLDDATLGVVRVDSERLDEAWEFIRTRHARIFEPDDEIPELEHPASRLVAASLESLPQPSQVVRDPEAGLQFEELAADRPLYFAVTDRRNRRQFRLLRSGEPLGAASSLRRGVAARLVLPSDRPTQLVESLRDHCRGDSEEWMGGACGATARIRSGDRHAVVDLLYGVAEEKVDAFADELGDELRGEGGYFDRSTPAARAFLGRPTAVGAYAKTSDLAKLTLLSKRQRMLQQHRELSTRHRNAGFAQVLEALFQHAALESPEAREFEDVAFLARAAEERGLTSDVIQTYTRRGAKLAEASRIEASLPTIEMEDSDIRVEWAADLPAAFEQAVVPPVLFDPRSRPYGGSSSGSKPSSEGWEGTLAAALEATTGLVMAMAIQPPDREFTLRRTLRRLVGLRAARAELRFRPDRGNSFGFAPVGGAALLVDRDSNLDAAVEAFVALAKRLGWAVRYGASRRDDGTLLRMTFGRSMDLFGDSSPIADDPTGRVDVRDLAKRVARSDTDLQKPADGLREAPDLETASLQWTSSDTARGLRLSVGSNAAPELALPNSEIEVASPDVPPECVREVARLSAAITYETIPDQSLGKRRGLLAFRGLLPELAETAAGCGEGTPWSKRVESVVAAQYSRYGESLARLGLWSGAAGAFAEACDFGRGGDCDRRKRFEERTRKVELLDLTGAPVLDAGIDGPALVVSRDELYAGAERILPETNLSDLAAKGVGSSVVSAFEERFSPEPMEVLFRDFQFVPLAVDRSVPVERVERVQAHAKQLDGLSLLFAWVGQRPPETVVGEPALEGIPLAVGGLSAGRDEGQTLRVRVEPDGWTVLEREGPEPPVDGCPEEGPTVCLSDAGSSVEQEVASLAETQKQERARELTDEISEAYPYHRFHDVIVEVFERRGLGDEWGLERMVLEVDGRLPFEVAAETAAAAARRGGGDYESSRALFSDRQRRYAMFDQFLLTTPANR